MSVLPLIFAIYFFLQCTINEAFFFYLQQVSLLPFLIISSSLFLLNIIINLFPELYIYLQKSVPCYFFFVIVLFICLRSIFFVVKKIDLSLFWQLDTWLAPGILPFNWSEKRHEMSQVRLIK